MADFRDVRLSSGDDQRSHSVSNNDVDKLDDYHDDEFRGATLSLTPEGISSPVSSRPETAVDNLEHSPNKMSGITPESQAENLSSCGGSGSSTHRVPPLRGASDEDIRQFFATRNGALDSAAKQCEPVILENLDGTLHGTWLLTEIDHWDTEKERLVFLTDYSLLLIKYDFITLKLLEYRRLHLKDFDKVFIGELKYPEKSLMPPRNQIGVRCTWGQEQPLPFLKNWNPWSREIPYVTLTSHPLVKQEGASSNRYDIETFADLLAQTVERLDITQAPPHNALTPLRVCSLHYQPVLVENYAGVVSAFHNANDFGFFKSRGKVSF